MGLFNRIATASVGPIGSPKLLIDDLRIAFKVEKSSTSEPNTGSLTITNLSETSRELITKVDDDVILSAGYVDGDGLEVLLIGTITNIHHVKELPDIHTIIDVADGQKELKKVVSVSYAENSQLSNVIADIANRIGLTVKTPVATLNIHQTLDNGFSFGPGPARSALDKLTKFAGIDWSVQNKEIKFTNPDGADRTNAIRLSSDSGLVGHPQRLYAKKTKTGKIQKGSFDGWRIKSLLQPKAEPGGLVKIVSIDVPEATFKIIAVEHVGDTHGNEFLTTMELQQIV